MPGLGDGCPDRKGWTSTLNAKCTHGPSGAEIGLCWEILNLISCKRAQLQGSTGESGRRLRLPSQAPPPGGSRPLPMGLKLP